MDESEDMKVEINLDSLTRLSSMWQFKIHGDHVLECEAYNLVSWDLEFEDVYHASSFANTISAIADIRELTIRDPVTSLDETVVLSLTVRSAN